MERAGSPSAARIPLVRPLRLEFGRGRRPEVTNGPSATQMRYHTTMQAISVEPSELFRALADPTRIRILRLLADTGEEACLCELVDSLREPQYKLSRHVKILRHAGLLSAERDGRWVYHRLVRGPRSLDLAHEMLRSLPDGQGNFARDQRNFRDRIALRERGRCRVGIQSAALFAGEAE